MVSRELEVEQELQAKAKQLEKYDELHIRLEENIKVEQEKCESYQERIKQVLV